MTYMPKLETKRGKCTLDPSILRLIQELAQALQVHHLQYAANEPVPGGYARDIADLSLINQAEDFLMIAQERTQSWRVSPREYRPPGTGPK